MIEAARASGWALRVAVGAVIVASLAYVQFVPFKNALVEGLLWCSLLLAGMWAAGSIVVRALRLRLDHGLRMLVGASLFLCVGGWAMAFGVFTRFTCVAISCAGAIGAVALLWHPQDAERRRMAATGWHEHALWLGGGAVGLLGLAVALSDWRLHPADDGIAYLAFPEKILSTGAFSEPYSFRRLSALGGQSVLLAYLWPHIDPEQASAADRGIGLCLALAQLAFWPRAEIKSTAYGRALRCGAATFVCALATLSINTASLLTGLAWMLGLTRLASRARSAHSRPYWLAVALSAAAFASLRQFFMLPAMVAILYVGVRRKGAVRGVCTSIASAAAVAGFCVAALRSHGTFLYPIFPGMANPATSLTASATPLLLFRLLRLAERPAVVTCIGVVAIVAFAGALPRSLRILSGAAGAYACILVAALGLSDTRDIERYSIPILAAVALIIAFSAHTVGHSGKLRVALCACAFFWGAHRIGTAELETPETYVRFLSTAWSASPRVGRTETWEEIELRKAQASVPDGERIFAAVDDPYRLDFRRNDILIADMPGYTGGLPTLQGPNALAKYLREHEVAYILFVKAQYSKDYYRTSIRNSMLQGDNAIWKTMAILTLDFSENLTLIARDYPPVYDSDGLVVVRLQLGSTSWPR